MAAKYAKDQPPGFTNRIEKVAIVGAGGQMGRHLTEQLLKTGKHVVTAIARVDSTNKLPDGVRVARVDYSGDDDTALVAALRGQQVLLITMAVTAPHDTMSKLIRAAAKAGVPYVQPNWYGHDPANDALCGDVGLAARRDSILAEIAGLGVSAALLLACNFWYEFSLGGGPDRYGFDFNKRTFVVFDDGAVPINTTTWPQCGRAIASLLSLKELPDDAADTAPCVAQFRDRALYVSSFRVSQLDMFESVKRVTRTSDADWAVSHEQSHQRWSDARAKLQGGDWGAFTKMLYSRTFFAGGGGDFESSRGLHNGLLGLPVEDLDEATAVAVRMGLNGEVAVSH